MDSKTVSTFSSFVGHIETSALGSQLVLFRGQGIQGNLLPRIARICSKTNTELVEKEMLRELKRMGGAFLDATHDDEWELMVLAQHYGLATRLLDWTSNPLAALWFSCSAMQDGDCYVYVLDASELVIPPENVKGPFENPSTRVFQPRLNNARLVAQDGWFTAHRYSGRHGRFVKLETNKKVKDYVSEIVIPEDQRKAMLSSLDRHGINSRTLFPDLEGLCKYLSWRSEAALKDHLTTGANEQ